MLTCEISSKSLVIFHARSKRDFDEREKTRKKKTCRSFSAGRWENSSLSRLHARIVDVRQIYFFRVKQTMRERDFGASSAMFVCGGGVEKCRLCRMTCFQAEWNELRKRCGVRNQLILVDHDKQWNQFHSNHVLASKNRYPPALEGCLLESFHR